MTKAPPKLIGRPYRPPKCQPGQVLGCLLYGDRVVHSIRDAPIPWPQDQRRSLFLVGDLVEAVRKESVSALCYWFGVGDTQALNWRRRLGIPRFNQGTTQLWSDLQPVRFAGRTPGPEHGSRKRKLSPSVIAQIRERSQAGETRTALAKEFGVSRQAIYRCATGQTWPE